MSLDGLAMSLDGLAMSLDGLAMSLGGLAMSLGGLTMSLGGLAMSLGDKSTSSQVSGLASLVGSEVAAASSRLLVLQESRASLEMLLASNTALIQVISPQAQLSTRGEGEVDRYVQVTLLLMSDALKVLPHGLGLAELLTTGADVLLVQVVPVVLDVFLLDTEIVSAWSNLVVQSKVLEGRGHIGGGTGIGTGSNDGTRTHILPSIVRNGFLADLHGVDATVHLDASHASFALVGLEVHGKAGRSASEALVTVLTLGSLDAPVKLQQ
jgi:hypothetical protein